MGQKGRLDPGIEGKASEAYRAIIIEQVRNPPRDRRRRSERDKLRPQRVRLFTRLAGQQFHAFATSKAGNALAQARRSSR
jgi:hypothetical protein